MAVFGERYFTLLRDDCEASAIARKLRAFSDDDLAWIPHLSETNRMLICAHFGCDQYALDLAWRYESARRKAFPITGNSARVDSAEVISPATTALSSLSEIGAAPSAEAAAGAPSPPQTPAAAVNSQERAA